MADRKKIRTEKTDKVAPASSSKASAPKKHSTGRWLAGCCALLFFLGSVGINIILGAVLVSGSSAALFGGEEKYQEIIYRGTGSESDRVVMIDLTGVMVNGNEGASLLGESGGIGDVLDQLDIVLNDESIKAVVFNVDSPGGSVTAAEDLYQKVREVQEAGVYVVTYIHGTGASGAYYGTVSSDFIYANPTSINGSIGVIVQSYDYEELLKKVGVSVNTFKSGEFKDLLDGSRELKPGERDIIQSLVNDSYGIFLDRVEDGRDIPREELVKIADGRIYTASQAKELALIDEVGYEGDALKKAASLADLASYDVIRYEQNFSLFEELGTLPFGLSHAFVKNLLSGQSRTLELFYL